jgi:hypothetical protein
MQQLPWIRPDEWAPGARELLAEAEALVPLLEDSVGLELFGALGGLTSVQSRDRLRQLSALRDLLDVEQELLDPLRPLVARCLFRLASASPRGRAIAAFALLKLATEAQPRGHGDALLPSHWLRSWATSPLTPLFWFAQATRARLAGPTREPTLLELYQDDDYGDYMERADRHEVTATPPAPVSPWFLYEPCGVDGLEGPVRRELDPSGGGTWFRVRRYPSSRVIGFAGLVPRAESCAGLVLAPRPPHVHQMVEPIASIARHATLVLGAPRLEGDLAERAAFTGAGFRELDGRLVLDRETVERACAPRVPEVSGDADG